MKESKETRLVWITLLAMKDFDGVVKSSMVGLADRAKVDLEECRRAIAIFLAPDPDDTSKVEDGRRLREIQGGWQIVNNDLYRFSTEEKRGVWREQKARQRAAKAQRQADAQAGRRRRQGGSTEEERLYVEGVRNGTIDPNTGDPVIPAGKIVAPEDPMPIGPTSNSDGI